MAPILDYGAYEKAFHNLAEVADSQCSRTLKYIKEHPVAQFYNRDKYPIFNIPTIDTFEEIFTFSVTVDNFNEFAAKAEKLCGIVLKKETIVLSYDDLLVYGGYFDSPIDFLHYFKQRKSAMRVPQYQMNDEFDHLGLYIDRNLYALNPSQYGDVKSVFWNGFRHDIDEYFNAKLPLYDPYALQDAWTLAYPNLYGYNCRITAYSLMADFIQVNSNAEKRDDYLVFDLLALDTDSDVFVNEQERDSFRVLFSAIPTDNTQDINAHVKNIQEIWKERGISFKNNNGVSMVSVFLHDMLSENESELIIGHVGVLLKQKNGELLFIEKVAFQEPYQVVRLANRTELNDYLMGKYDISYGQETAHPIIFENDKLLEGYRINPNNTDKDSSEAMETTQEEQKDDEISTFSGILEEKKDSMFIIESEDGEAYSIGFEEAPEGYDELNEGDKVVMEYTGELSVVDAFTGEIISLKRAE